MIDIVDGQGPDEQDRGATMIDLPLDDAVFGVRLVGVDHDGTAILRQDSRLLRWSKLGGRRELMNAAPE